MKKPEQELYRKEKQLQADKRNKTNLVLNYEISGEIADCTTFSMAEHDRRLNEIHTSIRDFVAGLNKQDILSSDLEELFAAELERLSSVYSDERMAVKCLMLGLERDNVTGQVS